MFLKTSRYYKTATIETQDIQGRNVSAIKIRRLSDTNGEQIIVDNRHKLDVMSKSQYKDGAKFWHIADANSELQANALVGTVGEIIKVPKA